jgi:hypothetical protein
LYEFTIFYYFVLGGMAKGHELIQQLLH